MVTQKRIPTTRVRAGENVLRKILISHAINAISDIACDKCDIICDVAFVAFVTCDVAFVAFISYDIFHNTLSPALTQKNLTH